MQAARILSLSILAAVAYGEIHDQITARLCLEYFTVFHPPTVLNDLGSPTLEAIYWGFVATWWVGLILGLGLVVAARAGPLPRLTAGELRRPILWLMTGTALFALTAGIIGGLLPFQEQLYNPRLLLRLPVEHRHFLQVDAFAHLASYAGGFFGGVVLWVQVYLRRARLSVRAA